MRLNISPCPHSAIHLHGYERAVFPEFAVLFETPSPSSPLRYFCRDSEEAFLSVILENHCEKAITALRYQWVTIDAAGERRTHTSSGDSYAVDVFRAIAEPRSRHLLSPSGSVDEALLANVRAGGGFIGCVSAGRRSWAVIAEGTFEIQFILFADGEIVGPDPDHYAVELQSRKPAAEFVARQIRLAESEARDVIPVLSALAEPPSFGGLGRAQGDPFDHWVRHYSKDFLRTMSRRFVGIDMRAAKLRHLENRPELPRFYRQPPPTQ
jgi:hypothetical protein